MFRLNLLLTFAATLLVLGITIWLNTPGGAPSIREVPVPAQETYADFPIAPDVELIDMDGNSMQLHDFKGKTIVLNFWASWCAPCLVEFPQLINLAKKKQDDLVFVAVSVDAEKDNIPKFFEKLDAEYKAFLYEENIHIIWDPQKDISQDTFQTIRYPETLIIAPDLTMRKKIIGASVDFSSQEFIAELEASTQ